MTKVLVIIGRFDQNVMVSSSRVAMGQLIDAPVLAGSCTLLGSQDMVDSEQAIVVSKKSQRSGLLTLKEALHNKRMERLADIKVKCESLSQSYYRHVLMDYRNSAAEPDE